MTKKARGSKPIPTVTVETETELLEIPQSVEVTVNPNMRYDKKVWLQLRRAANGVSTGMTAKEFEQYLNDLNASRAEKRERRHENYARKVDGHLNDVQAMSEKEQSYIICLTQNDGRDCKPITVTPENRVEKLRKFAHIASMYAELRDMAKDTGISVQDVVSQSPWRLDVFDKGQHITVPGFSSIGLKSLINIERIVNLFDYRRKINDLI